MREKVYLITCFCLMSIVSVQILEQSDLAPSMFTSIITGDLLPLRPTTVAISKNWPFPIEVYEITMMRTRHQFLPLNFNSTEIFAYAGKINGQLVPSFPGPTISVLKNMPCYIKYINNIVGTHILPVDTSPSFSMISQYMNEVPTVTHVHGLETESGSDGAPMGYFTKSGRRGFDYYSLRSDGLQINEAIYRYFNTKEGLFWYHDHTMGITRLNVYAGLVGFYEIIDPQVSS